MRIKAQWPSCLCCRIRFPKPGCLLSSTFIGCSAVAHCQRLCFLERHPCLTDTHRITLCRVCPNVLKRIFILSDRAYRTHATQEHYAWIAFNLLNPSKSRLRGKKRTVLVRKWVRPSLPISNSLMGTVYWRMVVPWQTGTSRQGRGPARGVCVCVCALLTFWGQGERKTVSL